MSLVCKVCSTDYDCEYHRPVVGTCGHSICSNCSERMTVICPTCSCGSFRNAVPNHELMAQIEKKSRSVKGKISKKFSGLFKKDHKHDCPSYAPPPPPSEYSTYSTISAPSESSIHAVVSPPIPPPPRTEYPSYMAMRSQPVLEVSTAFPSQRFAQTNSSVTTSYSEAYEERHQSVYMESKKEIGVTSGAIGLSSGSIGITSGSIGVTSGSVGVTSGSIAVTSGSIGLSKAESIGVCTERHSDVIVSPGRTITVGNFYPFYDRNRLRDMLELYGPLESFDMAVDSNGRPIGNATATFMENSHAGWAYSALGDKSSGTMGKLMVSWAS